MKIYLLLVVVTLDLLSAEQSKLWNMFKNMVMKTEGGQNQELQEIIQMKKITIKVEVDLEIMVKDIKEQDTLGLLSKEKPWDLDQPGKDIDSVLDVQTWQKCADLKYGKSRARPVNGLVSGFSGCTNDTQVSPCESEDTDLPGNDIDFVFNVPTWEKCSSLCSEHSGCFFWTWVDDSYTLNLALIHKCHLKNGNSRPASITSLTLVCVLFIYLVQDSP